MTLPPFLALIFTLHISGILQTTSTKPPHNSPTFLNRSTLQRWSGRPTRFTITVSPKNLMSTCPSCSIHLSSFKKLQPNHLLSSGRIFTACSPLAERNKTVLNEVDKLSREAQHSLRRTIEKYSASCRLILCSNSSSKVTEAVRSRCLNVRINAPMEEEIVNVLEFIAKKEGLQLPQGFAARIVEKSNRNLRRAVLTFETCRVQQYPFTNNQAIPPMDWEQYVSEIASDIMKEQSPKRLFEVRGKLYELLTNCIPPEIILKRLLFELLKKLDSELKHEVSNWAAHYEHRMRLGQKAIFHLEAFVAKFMSIYKSFLISTFG